MPRVLVVDDSAPMRHLLKGTLRRRGFEVVEAANGIEAIHLAGSRPPVVILMDLNMPGIDGFTTTALLKSNPDTSSIPVVAVSGVRVAEEGGRMRAFGFEKYMMKPLRMDTLADLVEALARGRAAPAPTP